MNLLRHSALVIFMMAGFMSQKHPHSVLCMHLSRMLIGIVSDHRSHRYCECTSVKALWWCRNHERRGTTGRKTQPRRWQQLLCARPALRRAGKHPSHFVLSINDKTPKVPSRPRSGPAAVSTRLAGCSRHGRVVNHASMIAERV